MLWFILKYGGFAFGAWFLWGLRNWIRKPWGEYISHTKLRDGTVFLKVRHWSRLPPWLPYERSWVKTKYSGPWREERTGKEPEWAYSQGGTLTAMVEIAESRQREIDEILNGTVN